VKKREIETNGSVLKFMEFMGQKKRVKDMPHKSMNTIVVWERPKNKPLCLPSPGACNRNKRNFGKKVGK